jgi:hypothetical protein
MGNLVNFEIATCTYLGEDRNSQWKTWFEGLRDSLVSFEIRRLTAMSTSLRPGPGLDRQADLDASSTPPRRPSACFLRVLTVFILTDSSLVEELAVLPDSQYWWLLAGKLDIS